MNVLFRHAGVMTTKAFSIAAIAILASVALQHSSASTIPAGTVLIVRTLLALSSVDVPGTLVPVQLVNNVSANGKVILPAGTKLNGKVETARRTVSSSQRLTVNLTSVQVGGRSVPIRTTGAYQVDNNNFKTARGISVGRVNYTVAVGRQMQFQLAEALKL
jgi:hypothetical protein